MGQDPIALAFAAWVDAHKKQLDAERRLGVAQRVAKSMGMQPPQALLDEVARYRAEAARLLAAAESTLRGSRGG